jgi:hypothetical protein
MTLTAHLKESNPFTDEMEGKEKMEFWNQQLDFQDPTHLGSSDRLLAKWVVQASQTPPRHRTSYTAWGTKW